MGKYEDQLKLSEEDKLNAQFKPKLDVDKVHWLFESILSFSQELERKVSQLCEMGLTPQNSAKLFAYVAQHQYLMQEALKPLTNLYEAASLKYEQEGRN